MSEQVGPWHVPLLGDAFHDDDLVDDDAREATSAVDTLVLTDEELLALEAEVPVVPLPYAAQIEAVHRDAVLATALRGLAARGLVRRHGEDLEVNATLAALLQVRAAAPVIVVVRRQVGVPAAEGAGQLLSPVPSGQDGDSVPDPLTSGQDEDLSAGRVAPGEHEESLVGLRHLHVVGEELVVEDVLGSGLHVFGVAGLSDVADVVAEFVDLDGAPPGQGEPVRLGTAPVPAGAGADPVAGMDADLARLGGPTTLADVVIRDATGPAGHAHLLTLALGPAGVWVSEGELSTVAGSPAQIRFDPCDVTEVATRVGLLVRAAVARVEARFGADADPPALDPGSTASATMGA